MARPPGCGSTPAIWTRGSAGTARRHPRKRGWVVLPDPRGEMTNRVAGAALLADVLRDLALEDYSGFLTALRTLDAPDLRDVLWIVAMYARWRRAGDPNRPQIDR